MRHNIEVTGHAFRLRPIELSDAQSIVDLRTSQPERSQFLHPISDDVSLQAAYLNKYFETPNDYYFVVERLKTGKTEGLIGIYDIDLNSQWGVWGRWIIAADSVAAVESCWLIYRVAFEQLHFKSVSPQTIADNESVVSFHDACGLPRNRVLPSFFCLAGKNYDCIEHLLDLPTWEKVDRDLGNKSKQIATLLNRRA
jgi:RimJ/RimL family protein N-acetyltransferase